MVVCICDDGLSHFLASNVNIASHFEGRRVHASLPRIVVAYAPPKLTEPGQVTVLMLI